MPERRIRYSLDDQRRFVVEGSKSSSTIRTAA